MPKLFTFVGMCVYIMHVGACACVSVCVCVSVSAAGPGAVSILQTVGQRVGAMF